MTDFGAVYAATRDRLIAEVRELDAAASATIVPSCPEWTVKDVIAHVAGLVGDLLAGYKPPLGSPEMTARQVAERAEATLAQICDEWSANAGGIAALMHETPMLGMGLTADLTIHYDDIAEAIDGVSAAPADAVAVACGRYVPLLQERVADRVDIALSVTLDGHTWEPLAGSTPLALSASGRDFLRSVTGRRSRSDVERALVWDDDATRVLDGAWLQYGDYRD